MKFLIAALLLITAAASARMLLGAHDELRRAEGMTGDPQEVVHLRRAMAYYLPGNPFVRRAHDRLLGLCRSAQREDRAAVALERWRELRSAILALRGLNRPYAETLSEANRAIARLSHPGGRAVGGLSQKTHRQLLDRPDEPAPHWVVLALLGFVLWVGGAAWLLTRGLRPDGRLRAGRVLHPAGLTIAGFALFALGLALA